MNRTQRTRRLSPLAISIRLPQESLSRACRPRVRIGRTSSMLISGFPPVKRTASLPQVASVPPADFRAAPCPRPRRHWFPTGLTDTPDSCARRSTRRTAKPLRTEVGQPSAAWLIAFWREKGGRTRVRTGCRRRRGPFVAVLAGEWSGLSLQGAAKRSAQPTSR